MEVQNALSYDRMSYDELKNILQEKVNAIDNPNVSIKSGEINGQFGFCLIKHTDEKHSESLFGLGLSIEKPKDDKEIVLYYEKYARFYSDCRKPSEIICTKRGYVYNICELDSFLNKF